MSPVVDSMREDAEPGNKSKQVQSTTMELFGLPIQSETMTEALNRVHQAVLTRRKLRIGVVNAAKIVNMQSDPELRESLLDSDVIYADGMSVVWASRILRKRLPERIAGIDLMTGILEQGDKHNYRVFCLGATPEVVDAVCRKFSLQYPGTAIVGSHHGYFNTHEERAVADQIREQEPDVLLVAITSPKKERFMARWADYLDVPVVHGVGGSFDVVADRVKRAPEAWQRLGLEWLFRLKQEPRRLWKRYLLTNTKYAVLTMKEIGAALRKNI